MQIIEDIKTASVAATPEAFKNAVAPVDESPGTGENPNGNEKEKNKLLIWALALVVGGLFLQKYVLKGKW